MNTLKLNPLKFKLGVRNVGRLARVLTVGRLATLQRVVLKDRIMRNAN